MKVIFKARGGGKTTDLIQLSSETRQYIVVKNMNEASQVQKMANKMECNIPFPLTYDEFLKGRFFSQGLTGVLIDNADRLIEHIAENNNIKVGAITINNPQ